MVKTIHLSDKSLLIHFCWPQKIEFILYLFPNRNISFQTEQKLPAQHSISTRMEILTWLLFYKYKFQFFFYRFLIFTNQGLHNISLQDNVCTARVCEVLLYILTTLLDLGLLKSDLANKDKQAKVEYSDIEDGIVQFLISKRKSGL